MNIIKTKFMAVGHDIAEEATQPISLEGGEIEHVSEFPYLGSSIAVNGRTDDEIDRRIANASKAFGALRQAVFTDANLSITTTRLLYQACVLSVLLYRGEYWYIKPVCCQCCSIEESVGISSLCVVSAAL